MADHPTDTVHAEERLWRELEQTRFGMPGVAGDAAHFQPMTGFAEPAARRIWFFTQRDSDLARAIGDGAPTAFILQAKDQDLQAVISGAASLSRDKAAIDRYWSPMVAAWFPKGKDDAGLTLIRLNADRAELWLSDAGPLKMAWEVAKANATHHQPDLGERASVKLTGQA